MKTEFYHNRYEFKKKHGIASVNYDLNLRKFRVVRRIKDETK